MEKDPNMRYTCEQALQHPWYGSCTRTMIANHFVLLQEIFDNST